MSGSGGIVDYDYDDDNTTSTRGLPSPNEANVRALFADQRRSPSAFYSFLACGDTIISGITRRTRRVSDDPRRRVEIESELRRTVRENAKTIADEIEKMWDETKKKRVVAMDIVKADWTLPLLWR